MLLIGLLRILMSIELQFQLLLNELVEYPMTVKILMRRQYFN